MRYQSSLPPSRLTLILIPMRVLMGTLSSSSSSSYLHPQPQPQHQPQPHPYKCPDAHTLTMNLNLFLPSSIHPSLPPFLPRSSLLLFLPPSLLPLTLTLPFTHYLPPSLSLPTLSMPPLPSSATLYTLTLLPPPSTSTCTRGGARGCAVRLLNWGSMAWRTRTPRRAPPPWCPGVARVPR